MTDRRILLAPQVTYVSGELDGLKPSSLKDTE